MTAELIQGLAVLMIGAAMSAKAGEGRTTPSRDGVPIRYDVVGSGEPALLFVHGWAFDRSLWRDDAARLSRRHRVITLDLAGHGQSGAERRDWTIAAFAGDVRAVADAARAKQVVLIGHSMGGPVVLEAARQMPGRVRGIVLVDTLLDVEQKIPPDQIDTMAGQLTADYAATATRMADGYLFAPGTPAAVRERVLHQALALPAERGVPMLRAAWTYDPLPALAEIKVPIRAVSADKFPTNLDANRRHMPGYEAQIIAGSGHYPMLENPPAFAAALDTALAQVLGRKP
jgi:pimeloyl-ACP methyl ester carboxylesterase